MIFTLYGCAGIGGEEIARMDFENLSNVELHTKEATINLKKGEKISFWSEIDLEFENQLMLVYTIEIWNDTTKLGGLQFDALETNPTFKEIRTSLGNKTTWSFTGKMDFWEVLEDGNYTFIAALASSDNPSLQLNKSTLILKK